MRSRCATIEIDACARRALFAALASTVIGHAAELNELDRAIGDGDHGVNMSRGFNAVHAQLDALAALPLDRSLVELGKCLVMNIGGASGPLYGTFFMVLGSQVGPGPLTRERLCAAIVAAVAGVQARGRSDLGQKTLLDVLIPVAQELGRAGDDLLPRIRARAIAAAAATVPLRAERGRAAGLGERSVGHLDPGARSSELLIVAFCDSWFAQRNGQHVE